MNGSSPNMKRSKVTEYVKNLRSSLKYSASKVMQSHMPVLTETINSNASAAKDVIDFMKRNRSNLTRSAIAMETIPEIKYLRQAMTNLKEDATTGKFYNKERDDEGMSDVMKAMGIEFDSSFTATNFGEYGDIDENYGTEQGSSTHSDIAKLMSTSQAAQASNTELLINSLSTVQSKTTEYLGNVQLQIANTNLAYLGKAHVEQMGVLKNIENIASSMFELHNNILTESTNRASSFYDEAVNEMRQIREYMHESTEMQRNVYNGGYSEGIKSSKVTIDSIMDSTGVPNFKEYFKGIKQNLTDMTMAGVGGGMNRQMLQTMMASAASSPWAFLSDLMVRGFMPKAMKIGMEQLDSSVSGLFSSLVLRMNSMAKNKDGVSGFLGKLLGIDLSPAKLDLTYHKRMGMTGDVELRKAKTIIEVIPEYLSKLVAFHTGKEMKYNHSTGKFIEKQEAKKEYDKRFHEIGRGEMKTTEEGLRANVSKFNFKNKKQNIQMSNDLDTFIQYLMKGERFNPRKTTYNDLKDKGVNLSLGEDAYKIIQAAFLEMPRSQQMRVSTEQIKSISAQRRKMKEYNMDLQNSGMSSLYNGFDVDYDKLPGKMNPLDIKKPRMNASMKKEISSLVKDEVTQLTRQRGAKNVNDIKDVTRQSMDVIRGQIRKTSEFRAMEADKNQQDQQSKFFEKFMGTSNVSKRFDMLKGKVAQMIKSPTDFVVGALDMIDKTIYKIVYGSDDEDPEHQSIIGKIRKTFNDMGEKALSFMDNKIIKPIHTQLFGDKGIFTNFTGKDFTKRFKNFLPKGVAGALTGMMAGAILPGGPILGAFIGSGISFAQQSEKFKESLFGKKDKDGNRDESGIIPTKYQKLFKRFAPAGARGLVTGGVIGGLFGPFGFATHAILGSIGGIVTESDRFKNWMWGKEDVESGIRSGGVAGSVKKFMQEELFTPFKNYLRKSKDNIKSWFSSAIAGPLEAGREPMRKAFEIVSNQLKDAWGKAMGGLKETIDGVFERNVGLPLKEFVKQRITDPLKNMLGKFFGFIGKAIGGIVSAPVKAITGIAKAIVEEHEKNEEAKNRSVHEKGVEKKGIWGRIQDSVSTFLGDKKNANSVGMGDPTASKISSLKDKADKAKEWAAKKLLDFKQKEVTKDNIKNQKDAMELKKEKDNIKRESESEKKHKSIIERFLPGYKSEGKANPIEQAQRNQDKSDKLINKLNNLINPSLNASERADQVSVKDDKPKSAKDIIMDKLKPTKNDDGTTTNKTAKKPSSKADKSDSKNTDTTIDMSNQMFKAMANNVKSINAEVRGQLNGVGYNLEYIKNILEDQFGSPRVMPRALSYIRGNFKRKGLLGMLFGGMYKLVTSPLKFFKNMVGTIFEKLNFGKIIGKGVVGLGKLISMPFKAIGYIGSFAKIMAQGGLETLKVLGSAAKGTLNFFGSMAKGMGSGIGKGLGAIGHGIGKGILGLGSGIQAVGSGLNTLAKNVLPLVVDAFTTIGKAALGLVKTVGRILTKPIRMMFHKKTSSLFGVKKYKVEVVGGSLDTVKTVEVVKHIYYGGGDGSSGNGGNGPHIGPNPSGLSSKIRRVINPNLTDDEKANQISLRDKIKNSVIEKSKKEAISEFIGNKLKKGGLHWFADGGLVTKPKVVGVGEAGPEAIIPLSKLPRILANSGISSMFSTGSAPENIKMQSPWYNFGTNVTVFKDAVVPYKFKGDMLKAFKLGLVETVKVERLRKLQTNISKIKSPQDFFARIIELLYSNIEATLSLRPPINPVAKTSKLPSVAGAIGGAVASGVISALTNKSGSKTGNTNDTHGGASSGSGKGASDGASKTKKINPTDTFVKNPEGFTVHGFNPSSNSKNKGTDKSDKKTSAGEKDKSESWDKFKEKINSDQAADEIAIGITGKPNKTKSVQQMTPDEREKYIKEKYGKNSPDIKDAEKVLVPVGGGGKEDSTSAGSSNNSGGKKPSNGEKNSSDGGKKSSGPSGKGKGNKDIPEPTTMDEFLASLEDKSTSIVSSGKGDTSDVVTVDSFLKSLQDEATKLPDIKKRTKPVSAKEKLSLTLEDFGEAWNKNMMNNVTSDGSHEDAIINKYKNGRVSNPVDEMTSDEWIKYMKEKYKTTPDVSLASTEKAAADKTKQAVKDNATKVMDELDNNGFISKVKKFMGNVGDNISGKFGKFKGAVSEDLTSAGLTRKDFMNDMNTAGGEVSDAWKGTKNWGNRVATNVANITSSAWKSVKQKGSDIWSNVKNGVSDTVQNAKEIGNDTLSDVKNLAQHEYVNAVPDAQKYIADTIPNKILGTAKNVASNTWDGIKALPSKVTTGVKNVASDVGDALSTVPSKIISGANWVKNGAVSGAKSVKDGVVNIGKSLVNPFKLTNILANGGIKMGEKVTAGQALKFLPKLAFNAGKGLFNMSTTGQLAKSLFSKGGAEAAAKGIGGKLFLPAMLLADAATGAYDTKNTFKVNSKDITAGMAAASELGTIGNDLTFGLLNKDTIANHIYDWFGGDTKSLAQNQAKYKSQYAEYKKKGGQLSFDDWNNQTNKTAGSKIWDGITNNAKYVKNGIVNNATWAKNKVKGATQAIGHGISSAGNWIGNALHNTKTGVSNFWNGTAKPGIANNLLYVKNGVKGFTQSIGHGVANAWDSTKKFGSNLIDDFKKGGKTIASVGGDIWNSVFGSNTAYAAEIDPKTGKEKVHAPVQKSLISKAGDWLNNNASYVSNGIKSVTSKAGDFISNNAKYIANSPVGKLVTGVTQALTDPVQFMQDHKKDIDGATAWVNNNSSWLKTKVTDGVKSLANSPLGKLVTGATQALTDPVGFIAAHKDQIKSVANTVKSTASNVLNSVTTGVTNVATNVKSAVKNGVNYAKTTASNVVSGAKTLASKAGNFITNTAKSVVSKVASLPSTIASTASGAAKATIQFGEDVWKKITDTLKPVTDTLGKVWDWLSKNFGKAYDWVKDNIFTPVKDTLGKAYDWLANTFGTAYNWVKDNVLAPIKDNLKSTWDWLSNTFSTTYNWVKDNVLSPIKTTFDSTWNWLSGTFGQAYMWVKDNVLSPIKTTFDNTWNWLSGTFGQAYMWVKDNVLSPIKSTFDSTWNWLSGTFGSMITTMSGYVADAKTGITNLYDHVVQVVSPVISTISNVINDVKSGINNVVTWVEKLADKFDPSAIANAIGGSVSSAVSSGLSLVKGVTGGAGDRKASSSYGRGNSDYKYYNQADPRWGKDAFGRYGGHTDTIAEGGCAPVSASIVNSTLTGKSITPDIMAKDALSMGYKLDNNGTLPQFFKASGNKYGVNYTDLSSQNSVVSALKANNPVVLMGQNFTGSNVPFGADSSHYVVATGVDSAGNVSILDPQNKSNNNKLFNASELLSNTTNAMVATKESSGRGQSKKDNRYGRGPLADAYNSITTFGNALNTSANGVVDFDKGISSWISSLTGIKDDSDSSDSSANGTAPASGGTALVGDMSHSQFIKTILPGALETWQKYKILPSISLAQAAEESGWGGSWLAKNDYNLFGIKMGGTLPADIPITQGSWATDDGGYYRHYNSWDDSIKDHGEFLDTNSRYRAAVGETNYVNAANDIANAGYATEAGYADRLINLIQQNGFDAADTGGTPPLAAGSGIRKLGRGGNNKTRNILNKHMNAGRGILSSIGNSFIDLSAIEKQMAPDVANSTWTTLNPYLNQAMQQSSQDAAQQAQDVVLQMINPEAYQQQQQATSLQNIGSVVDQNDAAGRGLGVSSNVSSIANSVAKNIIRKSQANIISKAENAIRTRKLINDIGSIPDKVTSVANQGRGTETNNETTQLLNSMMGIFSQMTQYLAVIAKNTSEPSQTTSNPNTTIIANGGNTAENNNSNSLLNGGNNPHNNSKFALIDGITNGPNY